LHKYSPSFGFETVGSMAENYSLHFPHFPLPCGSDATVKPTGMTDICSCSICTSYIRAGRIYGVLRNQMTVNTYATLYKTT